MKPFRWNAQKNSLLRSGLRVSFESIVVAMEGDGLIDLLRHSNPAKYPDQRVFVVSLDRYVHLVPFVEEDDYFVLETMIPSRKATRAYLEQDGTDGEP